MCFLALSFLAKIDSRTAVTFDWFFLKTAEVSQSFVDGCTAFYVLHSCRVFGTRVCRWPSLFANTNVLYFGQCAFFCSALESLCQTKLFLSRYLAKNLVPECISRLRSLYMWTVYPSFKALVWVTSRHWTREYDFGFTLLCMLPNRLRLRNRANEHQQSITQ